MPKREPTKKRALTRPSNAPQERPSSTVTGPAIGMLELSSVAYGMVAADQMIKRAAVMVERAEPVTPGKFIIVLLGGEEEVSQSLRAGLSAAADTVIDHLFLPKIDPQVLAALTGQFTAAPLGALGIVETFSVAAAIEAADRAVKNAQVRLVKMQLARGLGGRAYFVLCGEQHQLEAGVLAARQVIHQGMLLATQIIAQPDPAFYQTL